MEFGSIASARQAQWQVSPLPTISEDTEDRLSLAPELAFLKEKLTKQNDLLMHRMRCIFAGPPCLSLPCQPEFGFVVPSSVTLEPGMASPGDSSELESIASDTDSTTASTCSCDDIKAWRHHEELTTVVVKNLSATLACDDFVNFLNALGFHGEYDFLYLPISFATTQGFRYAFINFVSTEIARQAFNSLHGLTDVAIFGDMRCEVSWSDCQGLDSNIAKYRNSPVMHPSIPFDFRPLLFARGQVIPFLEPTTAIPRPRKNRQTKNE